MAPSMRARSANNTPVKGQDTFASEIDTLATPTRKVPHCSKCKRPRAGHPRSGCPFVTPTDENGSDRSSTNLSDALGSITLDGQETPPRKTPARRAGRRSLGPAPPSVPVEFEDTKQVIRERRRSEKATALAHSQTLQSLSDSDLEALLLPAGRDVSDDEKGGETEEEDHWKDRIEMLSAGGDIPTRAIMPGTLVTPSPWSSFASIPEENKHGIVQTSSPSNASSSSTETISVEIVSPSSATAPRPLARTMSMEERAGFIAHLEELSSAKAYVLSRADLTELRGRAPKGLYTRFLMDEEAGRNVLVVGRDELDTERLYQTLDAEKQQTMYATRGVSMKSAAGGAVFGAVATFTGLAFA
ncbi:hypothetical protein F5876DRAFT_62673 [Lentinula aff. lateritia]|uniref:Uncharacterized protein n=1 Tax=Lentinula aff. lateritia TaxID=2804960 RepID=A0ACC1UB35_9AGAR|nr:hypothetical protein F5876DRAFT_62673 [Lentinula aff. lateritia]